MSALPLISKWSVLGSDVRVEGQRTTSREEFPMVEAPHFNDGRDWFVNAKFGLFIHWGLYAISGWHEQMQNRANIPRETYVKLADRWNPIHFDPHKWIDIAESSGMKYICFTTKHHDGFCLWDTKQTAYNVMNTPYGKDVLKMLATACQERKMPLCLYYSVADWHHPNYPNQGRHHELSGAQPGDIPDWHEYMRFLKRQVVELCSNYGVIHGFWWDMNVPEYVDHSINDIIRELQPLAVINNRGFDEGDFGTPERQLVPGEKTRLEEACQSVGMYSWGYRKNEDYFTPLALMRSIDRFMCQGANYLLNVGPDHMGLVPGKSAEIVKTVGNWFKNVRESYYDVLPNTDLVDDKNLFVSTRGRTVYLHLHKEIISDALNLQPINVAPKSITLLNNNKPIDYEIVTLPNGPMAYLRIFHIPVSVLNNEVAVIKLEFEQDQKQLVQSPFSTEVQL